MTRVLIANRGEIAQRIVDACTDAGLESVAVYSDPDAEQSWVRSATAAYGLPGTSSTDTYLDAAALLDIARRSGADSVHPGYGFLSENADFAAAVIDAGLTWIGPPPEVIRALGDKITARDIARRAGAPLVPGSPGPIADADAVREFGVEHGYPLLVKAAHGGGGRGMRVVTGPDDAEEAFASAVREAIAGFGRGECFVERLLERPRHVEAQVLADAHGNVLVLGTRDCSLQRRHQKLVEEAPAPFLTDRVRGRIVEAARSIAREAGYVGAGTVEFLVSGDIVAFLEVNTRLQVEHPVTEAVTGVDLVRAQFEVAAGASIASWPEPESTGHAIEFRITAEDPARGFLPGAGTVTAFRVPTGPGIRIDTFLRDGASVPSAYDSLVAKLIVWGPDRSTAIRRARRALADLRIDGIAHVTPFARAVLEEHDFIADDPGGFRVHTTWIEDEFAGGLTPSEDFDQFGPAAGLEEIAVEFDGQMHRVRVPRDLLRGSPAPAVADTGESYPVDVDPAVLASPLHGTLVRWSVSDGAVVAQGDTVAAVEAMKMESAVVAHRGGVLRIAIPPGSPVSTGEAIARIDQS